MADEPLENTKITFKNATTSKEFIKDGPIKKGSIGNVYKVRDKEGQYYALKLLSDPSQHELFEENSKALAADGPLPYFIKTSTGKISEGATLEAAATMLLVIRHIEPQLKHHLCIKI